MSARTDAGRVRRWGSVARGAVAGLLLLVGIVGPAAAQVEPGSGPQQSSGEPPERLELAPESQVREAQDRLALMNQRIAALGSEGGARFTREAGALFAIAMALEAFPDPEGKLNQEVMSIRAHAAQLDNLPGHAPGLAPHARAALQRTVTALRL